ncbi:hypothetical protein BBO_08557 [Beauveria brongniartii RCEF 3172]|uniref:Rhodopsin domain-containing protein n=1 Tax=Beauveria brongniartii RCEF 3172 TaxID=1081107 RepID=A0A166XE48_9HYPO|nr:hypothetical protein BBO_08557 [Beauveria brongniartii RCEF 3172]
MVERSANSLAYAMGWLYAAAVFAFAAYVWTRCKAKRWRLDDYFYTAAFIFAIAHAIFIAFCIVHSYGRPLHHIPKPDPAQMQLLLYLLSLGFARISCALFVSAVAHASPLVWPARTAAALSGSWSVASVLCLTLHGGKPWVGIMGESFFLRWVGIEATGILVELALFMISISLIWFLDMPKPRRTCLMAAFSTRLLLIPIIAARLVHLRSSHSSSPTSVTPSILTEAALAVSIMTGCAAAPRSLLATIPSPAYHVPNRPLTIYTYDRYRRIRKSNRSTSAWKGFLETSEATAYPPRVHISSMSREATLMTPEEEELWRMTIQRTTEVSVQHTRKHNLQNLGRNDTAV